jgi:hypothetical protein
MNSIKKRYWILSILGAVLIGILVFFMSYRSAKDILIKQTYHTTQVVTDVKWTLLERKLYSLEQQLNLLSRNKVINTLFTAPIENHTAQKADPQFDTYVESLLNNQGCHDLLLVRSSGEVVYTHNPTLDRTALPAEIYRIAQQGIEMQDSTTLKIILNETAPHQFYVSKSITDAKGVVLGALLLEIPKEFLSIELRNTINSDSLTSYLVSKLGIMDQHGKINPEKCISCRWNDDAFIQFSPPKKIGGTWTLLSVYPISEIKTQHSMYLASLDGMIAFFCSCYFGHDYPLYYSINSTGKRHNEYRYFVGSSYLECCIGIFDQNYSGILQTLICRCTGSQTDVQIGTISTGKAHGVDD